MIDLTNKKFGKLKVINYSHTDKYRMWNCLCECGNKKIVSTRNLNRGNVKSCGCLSPELARERRGIKHPKFKDIVGKKFNNLKVLERVKGKDSKRVYWSCLCVCGKKTIVEASKLKSGHTKSCGCKQYKRGKEHYNWNGGKQIDKNGYIIVLMRNTDKYFEMARNEGYVFEHRLVMAKKLGRPLTKYEIVHHINCNKADNRIENLELVNGYTHALITKMESEIKKLKKELEFYKNT